MWDSIAWKAAKKSYPERDVAEIRKRAGQGRDHDCLIGISGGVDSSYLTYVAKEKLGLRPLLVHIDAGWNSQQAVNNVEKLVEKGFRWLMPAPSQSFAALQKGLAASGRK